MAKATEKVGITERALIARINRKLNKQAQHLKICREDSRWFYDLGRYYTINLEINGILQTHLDLEDFGRELGALNPYEKLTE